MTERQRQIDAQLQIVRIVADTIRDLTAQSTLGGVPSGHLYAALMPTYTLMQYQSVIDLLKRAGLVEERNYLLSWIGPAKDAPLRSVDRPVEEATK